MSIKVRFAPSPTGYLHIGNIRAAALNYLYATKEKGSFILRIDDTDTQRSKPEYVDALLKDLKWLGINYDTSFHQSERFHRYNEIKEELIKSGYLYPCFETGDELEVKRKIQLSRGKPPVYDRSALKLTQEEIEQLKKAGKKPHWRFKLPDEKIEWPDLIKGNLNFLPGTMSDPILIREDGSYLYSLPSIVDDLDYHITHVLRGEDHISNTAVQIPIFKTVANIMAQPFHIQFGHTSLLLSSDGGKLSKREQSLTIQEMRKQEVEPMAILSYLTYTGTSQSVEAHHEISQLLNTFDIANYGGSAPKFNYDEIKNLSAKLFHTASLNWLQRCNYNTTLTQEQWELVKYNIDKASDIKTWEKMFDDNFLGKKINKQLAEYALETLPENPWNDTTWKAWTDVLKEKTGYKGKELYLPLREMLTGMTHGPEMKFLILLLGRETIYKRIKDVITI